MLPVELPIIDKLQATGNPLDKENDWKKLTINGKNLREKLILLILLSTRPGIF